MTGGNWLNNSEVVAGWVFNKKLSIHEIDPALFSSPYDKLMRRLREGESLSDLMSENFGAMNAAMQAADATAADVLSADLTKALAKSKVSYEASALFMSMSKRLERGDDVDVPAMLSVLERMENGEDVFMPLGEVKAEQIVFVPTHYQPIDKYVGGIPDSVLTIIAAPPGVGKTSLLGKIMLAKAAKEKKKKILFFSLEMTMGQIMHRFLEIGVEGKTAAERKDVLNRIITTDRSFTIDEIYAEASRRCRTDDVSMIGIDFADMMVRGENNAGVMEAIYTTTARLAKELKVPIILLAQLNDKYIGGIPQVNHIRWSRMAEAVARLILLIYNPSQLWADQGQDKKNNPLPTDSGRGYLIVGKSSFGTTMGGIGAIAIDWDGKTAWGDKSTGWFSLKGR
jgi:archaellum biogenesis ATPase FlaH